MEVNERTEREIGEGRRERKRRMKEGGQSGDTPQEKERERERETGYKVLKSTGRGK